MLQDNKFGGRVVVTTDCMAGSSSKGSLNAWLADKYGFDLATCNWAPNAGHFVHLDNGVRILTQQIPSAFINENVQLYINAGSSIDLDILWKEIATLEDNGYNIKDRLTIHPHANIITEENRMVEKQILKTGSTFKGCGSASANKVMRQQRLAKDYDSLQPFIKNRTIEINESVRKGMKVLIETAQGIDLDLNHAEYPYCTSRSCTPSQSVTDSGLAPQSVSNVIINMRTNPIRISNISAADGENNYSGSYWDAKEITWKQVAEDAGYSYDEFMEKYEFALLTSVTKKIRRVFTFPKERFYHNMNLTGFHYGNVLLSLNFVNFIDKNTYGVTTKDEVMTDKIKTWLHNNMDGYLNKIHWIRTGPAHSQIVEFLDGVSW